MVCIPECLPLADIISDTPECQRSHKDLKDTVFARLATEVCHDSKRRLPEGATKRNCLSAADSISFSGGASLGHRTREGRSRESYVNLAKSGVARKAITEGARRSSDPECSPSFVHLAFRVSSTENTPSTPRYCTARHTASSLPAIPRQERSSPVR